VGRERRSKIGDHGQREVSHAAHRIDELRHVFQGGAVPHARFTDAVGGAVNEDGAAFTADDRRR
jgi:hypothetical protein